MPLKIATSIGGETPALPEGPPYPCKDLTGWVGVSFWMPPGDSRLELLHNGEPLNSAALDNLVGMNKYWQENPEWLEMLDPSSPVHDDKMLERALYIDFWDEFLVPGSRVLDIGGGVGRMSQWALSRDCEVELVDPDLRSLWRALSSLAGGKGKLDLHWSTGESLPELPSFDAIIACEVLNYVEDARKIIDQAHRNLRPGGHLLLSVEARWGWAMSADVAEGSIDAFFNDGIVHVPGDRWVRTFTEEQIRELLDEFEIVKIQPSHYAFSGPFEMATGRLSADKAIEIEEKFRNHPIARNLNRAWMAVARKRESI